MRNADDEPLREIPRAEGPTWLDDQLCFALYAAGNTLTRAYRTLLARTGLTYPQYLVVLVLMEEGRATTGHLARRLDLAPNAITPMVERLVQLGLVAREPDPDDRRRVHLALTTAGRALDGELARVQGSLACSTGLDSASVADLRGRLNDLARAVAAQGPET